MAIYAISDIHGHKEVFLKGLEDIGFSGNDELYILGDMIDRGPLGISILQMVMDMPNVHCLFGNHELLMIDAICHGRDVSLWLKRNGGDVTNKDFYTLSKRKQADIIDFLLNLPAQVSVDVDGKNYTLIHASYHKDYEGIPISGIPYNILYDLVWRSPYRPLHDGTYTPLSTYDKSNSTFISGHVPVQRIAMQNLSEGIDPTRFLKPVKNHNLITIDGGLSLGKGVCTNGLIIYRLGNEGYETVIYHKPKEKV